MNANRIRRAALAVAGAAILATGLTTSVVAAAPAANSLIPAVGAEQAREVPIDAIKFPDIEVTKVAQTYHPETNTTSAAFYIRNVGKATAANIKLKQRYGTHSPGGGFYFSTPEYSTIPSLPPGVIVPRSVSCPASDHDCLGPWLQAEPVKHEIVTSNNGEWFEPS